MKRCSGFVVLAVAIVMSLPRGTTNGCGDKRYSAGPSRLGGVGVGTGGSRENNRCCRLYQLR
jgi:hypothetical protein